MYVYDQPDNACKLTDLVWKRTHTNVLVQPKVGKCGLQKSHRVQYAFEMVIHSRCKTQLHGARDWLRLRCSQKQSRREPLLSKLKHNSRLFDV